ncbi:unnamed protein product [Nezara viridula]|uniref:Uncharacterized protein n=1 Tax=Nezara viridula TaxID=85310 RepID=A0A9P0H6Z3_NEZVI|nr:unnamed protein product [Nezara viridula]
MIFDLARVRLRNATGRDVIPATPLFRISLLSRPQSTRQTKARVPRTVPLCSSFLPLPSSSHNNAVSYTAQSAYNRPLLNTCTVPQSPLIVSYLPCLLVFGPISRSTDEPLVTSTSSLALTSLRS